MIGEITYSKFDLPDSSVGISNTTQLLKLINIMSNDIMLNFEKHNKTFNKLLISDNQFNVSYTLADILTISKSGKYNGSEIYHFETTIDKEIINSLIKAKSAIDDSNTVMIQSNTTMGGEFQLELIFGGDIEYSNKVSYFLSNIIQQDTPEEFMAPFSQLKIGFNSDLLKEILSVNKDANTAKLYINLDGVMKLSFDNGKIKSKYYLVSKD
jgi:hypothetical protein